jgi:hypothetical protein
MALASWRPRFGPLAWVGVVAGLVAIVWAVLVLDPLGPATIDPDAAASVLYFQRITGGRQLEAFVPTTPKPLLTLVYGLTWSLFHDWRVLVWETIAMFGVAVGATAAFVARLAAIVADVTGSRRGTGSARDGADTGPGPGVVMVAGLAAAAFAAAALLASSDLLLEVSRANSLVWALAFWSIAGLAVTLPCVRPRLGGVALLLAGLCRFETFALIALAVLAAAIVWLDRRQAPAPMMVAGFAESAASLQARERQVSDAFARRCVVGAAIAVLALPLALLHDWLLAGDPLYWLSVPERYTAIYNAGLTSIGPLEYAGTFVGRFAPEWPLLVLAAVGLIALAVARAWLPLAGIAAIGLGVTALLFWLAIRAIYISNRYYEPIDLALTMAGAVGVGAIVAAVVGRVRLRSSGAVGAAAAAGGIVAAVVGAAVVWPALPWDKRATTEVTSVRAASANAAAMPAWIASNAPNLQPQAPSADTGPTPPTLPPESFGLLVPSRDVSRLAVESGLGLDAIGDAYAAVLGAGIDGLRNGQWVIHDAAADRPVALFKPFEVSAPTGRVAPAAGAADTDGVWIDTIRP